jgi:eukaryotic-like serine/threonine-protein kinase
MTGNRSVEMLSPNLLFAGRYRVERFLARGGMGEVYIAEHTATERRVALKVLFPHVRANDRARRSFELEARLANRIQSEHVVQVLDAGIDETSGSPFLVMELLHGQDLEQEVTQRGKLPPEEVVRLLQQVGSALDKAHGYRDRDGVHQPIIHRDLKPENLFLTRRESGDPCVKILDFGIAKVLGQQTQVTREVRGTPLFMAPEQSGGQKVSPATDVWALGLIALQLLCGRLYWRTAEDEGATVMALFAEIMTMPLDSPSLRLHERGVEVPWPPAFDRWFARCVCRDPSGRYASAGEAISDLGAVLGVVSVARTGPSMAQSTELPHTKTQLSEPRGILAVAASTPTPKHETSSALSQSIPQGVSPHAPSSKSNAAMGLLAAAALAGVGTSLFLATRPPAQIVAQAPSAATPMASSAATLTGSSGATPTASSEPPPPTVSVESASPSASAAAVRRAPGPASTKGTPTSLPPPRSPPAAPSPTVDHYSGR